MLARLAQRFDVRLTTIVGPIGLGKTVLLAQAVEQNQMVPLGQDVWIGCERIDADGGVFAASILQALGVGRPRHADLSVQSYVEAIVEAVWQQAPFDVALIFDEFQTIDSDSAGAEIVGALVELLPSNGHIVVSSREPMPFPVSKVRLADQLIEVGSTDLAFDDHEFELFLRSRPATTHVEHDGPRWPALAALVADSGSGAAVDYLWDEVLSKRPANDRQALALISEFSSFDQPLLEAVTEQDLSIKDLVDGLPMVMQGSDGSWQLHSLWGQTLRHRFSHQDRKDGLRRGGQHLLGRLEFLAAASAYSAADDLDGLTQTATAMCFRLLTNARVDESRQFLRLLPPRLASSGIAKLLEAFAELEMRHQWKALASFESAAKALRDAGQHDLEIQALFLASQISGLRDGHPPAPHLYPRAVELAEQGLDLARSMVARYDAYAALVSGDPIRALSYLDDFDGFGAERGTMLTDQLWTDAGYPEHVGEVTTSLVDVVDLHAGNQVNVQLSFALWARGEVPPELAVPVALEMIEVVAGQRNSYLHTQVLAVTTLAALATGDIELGRRLAEQTRQMTDDELGEKIGAYVEICEASVLIEEGDEDAALAMYADLLERLPLGKWPPRAYLTVLSQLYVLVPGCREMLDALRVGPALSEVLNASRALVEFRQDGHRNALDVIDWRRIGTLRANMSLSHLAEVALGAGVDLDSEFVEESMRFRVPHQVFNNLAKSGRPVAPLAKAALGALSGGPTFTLHLKVLGVMTLERDGVVVEDENWTRRERVRMLCGYLVHHPRSSRRDVAAALWPDLSEDKAYSNLRVNLRLLLQVLEPDRPTGGPSWFVETDGSILDLHRHRLSIDAVQFDELVDEARRADTRGVPGQALALYTEAVGLYQGDYLEDRSLDHWVEFDRIRLRSAAALASARIAELLLAKGEPEDSMAYATRALRTEPLLERAHRCRMRAFLGLENRGAAREAGQLLLSTLAEVGLVADSDSVAMLSSLGLLRESDPRVL